MPDIIAVIMAISWTPISSTTHGRCLPFSWRKDQPRYQKLLESMNY